MLFFPNLEPGYYEAGKFGCRIEDIVRIVPASVPYKFEDHTFLKFETVSLVPIQTKMLVPEMLTCSEVSAPVHVVSNMYRVVVD
jgi:Xaa-Pro aminopeptidase